MLLLGDSFQHIDEFSSECIVYIAINILRYCQNFESLN